MRESEKFKITVVFLGFCLLFLVIIGKAFYIQVLNNDKLLAYSESQLLRESTIYPKRGQILDRNNNPLAINIKTYNIFAIPKLISSKTKTMKQVSKILPEVSRDDLLEKIEGRNKFTWLQRKIKLTDEQIEELKKIEGVFVESQMSRFYPNHELAAQIIGFVGVDNNGLSGIEYSFNDVLRGEPKITKYLKDAKGRPIKFESYKYENKAKDIKLTIDKDIQAFAEKILKESVVQHDAVKGGIGVIDASNGEILAMANYPNFDPNEVSKSKIEHRKLSYISDPFEPGSVFKTLTVSSGLENKIIRPDTSYFCEHGRFQVQNHIIKESDTTKRHEWLTVSEIIKNSSNIGTTKIAFDLTFPVLNKTLKKFGIGEKTTIELTGESRGIYPDEDNVSPLKLSNLAFGQGVATTGLQILAAYAAIANGGTYYPPTLIRGETKKDAEGKQIISKETADLLTDMLVKVVDDGTGSKARIKFFKIAGKTGTAQKADTNGVYSSYIPSFVGYPVNINNKFVVYAYIDEPRNGDYYGNTVAAPIFRKITEYILFKNREFQQIALESEDLTNPPNIDYIKIKQASPRVLGKNQVPNFIGLDKLSAEKLADELGIKIDSHGFGVVKTQGPNAGESYSEGMTVKLFHEPPEL